MIVPWYEDRFFYFGCSVAALARIYAHHSVGKPYSYRFYKWSLSMALVGFSLHYINRYRLHNMQAVLEKSEAIKIVNALAPIGTKEGQQIDQYEDALKDTVKRINH